jgi:hypothetical protein
MTAIASELERVLKRLEPEAAKRLETRVREAIADVRPEGKPLPTLEEMKKRKPEIADLIGCMADEEFEILPQPALP